MDLKSEKCYIVKRIDYELENLLYDEQWSKAPIALIDTYLWVNNGYKPRVEVQLLYSLKNIYVRFKAREKKITASYLHPNDPVYKDSCVEFFINPFPEDTAKYLNVEINPLGTVRAEFGSRDKRDVVDPSLLKRIIVKSTVGKPVKGYYGSRSWSVSYRLPLSLLEQIYQNSFEGRNAAANFYKCGDETEYEHYGMWHPIKNSRPNFHLPEYFGIILFDK